MTLTLLADSDTVDKDWFNEVRDRIQEGNIDIVTKDLTAQKATVTSLPNQRFANHVQIYTDSGTVYAKDDTGNEIDNGTAGTDDHTVLGSAIDHVDNNGGGTVAIHDDLTLSTQVSKEPDNYLEIRGVGKPTITCKTSFALKLTQTEDTNTDFDSNHSRGDTTVSVVDASGFEAGNLIALSTDRTVESNRDANGVEWTVVQSVDNTNDNIEVAHPLEFDYNTSESTNVSHWVPIRFRITNLGFKVEGTDNRALQLQRFRESRVDNCTFIGSQENGDGKQDAVTVQSGVGFIGRDCRFENLNQGFLHKSSANEIRIENIQGSFCAQMVDFSGLARNGLVDGVQGYYSGLHAVTAHEDSLKITFTDIHDTQAGGTANIRCIGARIKNCYFKSDRTGTSDFNVSIGNWGSTIENADAFPVVLDGVYVEYGGGSNLDVQYGSDLYVNALKSNMDLNVAGTFNGEVYVENSHITGNINSDSNLRLSNVTLDPSSGSCLDLQNCNRLVANGCSFKGADRVVSNDNRDEPANGRRQFSACYFEDVTDFGTSWVSNSEYNYMFFGCWFENITNSFSSPQLDDTVSYGNEYRNVSSKLSQEVDTDSDGIPDSADGLTYSASSTLDFGSIADGATTSKTVTVTGASPGDPVAIGPPSGLEAGLIVTGVVTSSDTVEVRVANLSGSSVNPASGQYKIEVGKQ